MTTTTTERQTSGDSARTRVHPFARMLSGVVAAGVVLGVGEILSLLFSSASSPFFAVGSTTVDRTPAFAREFAIDTFGTNDKVALFVGMSIGIAIIAAIAGLLERPSRPIGSVILLVLGAVGVYAVLQRPTSSLGDVIPTVVGVVLGIAVLQALTRALEVPAGTVDGFMPRRKFLVLFGAAAAVAVAAGTVGRYLGDRVAGVAEDIKNFRLPTVAAGEKAAAVPAGTDIGVEGATTFVTPNNTFYRIDTALQVPQLTTAEWQLKIHGKVDREMTLSWDDLMARTPIERVVTLTCVSNEVGGPLAGNATWIGFPIKDILDEVGVQADADMLLSTSIDGMTIGSPVEALIDGRDAMLAISMNGEPLPVEHGYPVRQVVPGLYGFVSATKWVVDWELTRFDEATAYWTDRGWGDKAPIKTASRIDVPAAFAPVAPGPVRVAGTAWAQQRGIERVEVRVDNGPWQEATLAEQYTIDTWRQWFWDWEATAGNHNIQVRATDQDGNTQVEERTPPIPGGSTGWHTRTIIVS
ncbi:molybdopterin-dependent oxidoreductase [Rhodococcus sp. BP-349]|uniref:molybdopterin-dependent oxidoreductase n=1 Tax=unclassified Rhodococcus (in: high G+C Gram-positive bacteria) TaxID=192944 RepID=UPI001C9BB7F9|nr:MULTISPECIES: molybdopterin-dependent oxidoreductase [unclassified Rhodococcus (in: high G+C Gram-positive bacteria)]MBY6539892.1 molybdopterin-dependent oxidoreductase [Rhodococcus sp. BP-363]MBY6543780.1 molybdopterin-dependent oxidoreductase [Rhodococcus sp. BP-369]MBY6563010.1 molybdopterin-dependent oxidoreductase [Rhodococcus sp. BP-370]MBY6577302.1 molybdopterin-dependent oxidoreductase [Rhodococcus sp. BP-364]MBY6586603.1 molybdopterin-dependent oxidoreductase [Rhodococcus sp. BP-35